MFIIFTSSIIDKMTFELFWQALLLLGTVLRESSSINARLENRTRSLKQYNEINDNPPSKRWCSWFPKSKSRQIKEDNYKTATKYMDRAIKEFTDAKNAFDKHTELVNRLINECTKFICMYDACRVIKDAAIKVAIAERLRILLDTAVEDVKNTTESYVNDVLHFCMVKQEDYDITLKADENKAVLASKKWEEANSDANDSATILFNTARDPNNILSTYCLGVNLLEST